MANTLALDIAAREDGHGIVLDRDAEVPMRDGAKLWANVFRPEAEGQYPVLMTLGPYGKDLHFSDYQPAAWKAMTGANPRVTGTAESVVAASRGGWRPAGPEPTPIGSEEGNHDEVPRSVEADPARRWASDRTSAPATPLHQRGRRDRGQVTSGTGQEEELRKAVIDALEKLKT